MPKIIINRTDFFNLLQKEFTIAELDEALVSVKGELKNYDKEKDELVIELNDTNRQDLWCPEGIARQLRFKLKNNGGYANLDFKTFTPHHEIFVDANLEPVRPYISAFIARNKKIDDQMLKQLIQVQEKLAELYGKKREKIAIGIYNYDKIAFPIQYKAAEPGSIRFVPLGSEESMSLAEILVKHPKGIEFACLMHNKPKYPVLVDENNEVVSFPPVINSNKSGYVKIGDSNLFVEVTGTDLNMVLLTVNIMAYNLKDRGFEIAPVMTRFPFDTALGREILSPYPLQNSMEVDVKLINKYLGLTYPMETIRGYLNDYGVEVEILDAERFKASTLPYRQDYMHAVDVLEDLAISIGYNNIEPVVTEEFTIGKMAPITIYEDKIRDVMVGFGFEEIISNMLCNKRDFQNKMNDQFTGDLVELANALAEPYSVLRNSLIPALLKIEATSFNALYPHRVFEIGEVVRKDLSQNHGCRTQLVLSALLTHSEANFSEMAGYFENLNYLMCWEAEIDAKNFPIFIAGRSGMIVINGTEAGIIGEVHPEILDKWNVKMPAILFELDLSLLYGYY